MGTIPPVRGREITLRPLHERFIQERDDGTAVWRPDYIWRPARRSTTADGSATVSGSSSGSAAPSPRVRTFDAFCALHVYLTSCVLSPSCNSSLSFGRPHILTGRPGRPATQSRERDAVLARLVRWFGYTAYFPFTRRNPSRPPVGPPCAADLVCRLLRYRFSDDSTNAAAVIRALQRDQARLPEYEQWYSDPDTRPFFSATSGFDVLSRSGVRYVWSLADGWRWYIARGQPWPLPQWVVPACDVNQLFLRLTGFGDREFARYRFSP